jgi:hypothetical protein
MLRRAKFEVENCFGAWTKWQVKFIAAHTLSIVEGLRFRYSTFIADE